MFLRKTKIVCSMGPAVDSDEITEELILAGMNVARFNFSHGSHEEHGMRMERVRRLAEKTGCPVALMMDTKGPEIRSGVVAGNGTVSVEEGERVLVTAGGEPVTGKTENAPARISVSWKDLPRRVSAGVKILIADGLLELEVMSSDGETVVCEARNSAVIGSKKNVNLIGIHAGLPIMSDIDKADIAFAAKMNADFVAASFVSFAAEVDEIRSYIASLNSQMRIIAKIENEEGLNNIKEIIAAADGIMVARGDLGVQLPTERIPLAQKYIIAECRKAGKPVITATQMLDSMIVNPRPTRAELTDVANAVFDGTDAVMLSGETANGAWPVESVKTMARIAAAIEESSEYCRRIKADCPDAADCADIGQIMARMAYMTADQIHAASIITPTLRGNTARMISTFRPQQLIIAVTPYPSVQRQLMLNWGVVPFLCKIADDSEEMLQNAVKTALDTGAVRISDKIVMCAGIPLSNPVMVNTVRVLHVGNVLVRGSIGSGSGGNFRAAGRIVKASSAEEAYGGLRRKKGEILLCPQLDESYVPLLRLVDGVICERSGSFSEMLPLINPRLVWIADVPDAMKILENGLSVTVDGKELLVYEGVV
ncbi:MAG: pyruvate kinase [Bacteroides sp.]|nr:pyruvate kinase [Prevotella sp.]MCM1408515.1 pyruvate kinase [Treponema brennaborense]MCM1469324.1 pyruvate kinase [Bacteroides sp.]